MKTNLKVVRKSVGMTQQEAAKKSGIPLGTIRRWEQGVNEPDMESVIKLAQLYGTSTDTILGSQFADDIEGLRKVSFSGFVDVPLYGSIAAGVPIEMVPVDDTHPIPDVMHERYPDAFLLRVKGESMNRVIPNGSYVLIDPRQRELVTDGQPYAVCVNGFDATVKRVKRLANGVQLVPDSNDPTYPVQTFDFADPDVETVTIIGRVVWYCIPFDWDFD